MCSAYVQWISKDKQFLTTINKQKKILGKWVPHELHEKYNRRNNLRSAMCAKNNLFSDNKEICDRH